MSLIGVSQRRRDGASKVTGATCYTADVAISQLSYARLLLSPYAHARITRVNLQPAMNAPGVLAAVAGADLTNSAKGNPIRTILAKDVVRYCGEPVAAVVAESVGAATDAVALIEVDYEPLPVVVDPLDAMEPGAPEVLPPDWKLLSSEGDHGAVPGESSDEERPRNCSSMIRHVLGDAGASLETAAHVVGGRFRIAGVHQAFMETHVVTARAEPDGGYTLWTSTQGNFSIRDRTARFLGIEPSEIRVVPVAIGGGFGGKLDPLLEPLTCALAELTGRPVRLELTRTEEFLMGRGGPAALIDLRVGAKADGQLCGLVARVVFDTGAGPSGLGHLAAVVLASTYRVPAYEVTCLDVATHKTPVAPYRAPGAPQVYFALETALDELAEQLRMDPIEFRLGNASREGDHRSDGSSWPRIGLVECLHKARDHPLYVAPVAPGEGIGVAVGGVTGTVLPSTAGCRLDRDGTLWVQTGSVDLTGTDAVLAAIAAEAFGVDLDAVRLESNDTSRSPFTGPSAGSTVVYSLGTAVKAAAEAVREKALAIAAEYLEVDPSDLQLSHGVISVLGAPTRSMALAQVAVSGPIQGEGSAGPLDTAPMFAVQIARAALDAETGGFRVTGFVAVQDVGKAFNPAAIGSQIHGGVAQGLGRALGEEIHCTPEGQVQTTSFLDYGIPSIDQVPVVDTSLVEVPSEQGPWGARGVGEPPCVPGSAALANALRRAGSRSIRALPISGSDLVR